MSSTNQTWDAIIVGGGTCGLTAATFAARRGAKVLVLEAGDELGGTLLVAHGQVSAAGTKLQAQKGIHDTPEMHWEEVLRISKGTVDHDLARMAVFNAAATFDWLVDHGYDVLPFCPVASYYHEPYRAPRYYWGKDWGRSIAKVLVAEVDKEQAAGRITVKTSMPVTGLLQQPDGAVTGVTAGTDRRFVGKSVLLSAGGYAGSPDMFREVTGIPLFAKMAYRHNVGVGYRLGVAAGGYLRGREKYLCNFGFILESDAFPSPFTGRCNTYPEDRPIAEIYVNSRGQRFIREDEPSVDMREHALMKQPDLRYWIVFDQAMFDQFPPMVVDWTKEQMIAAFANHKMFYRANSVEELAARTGIDAKGLAATISAYNRSQAGGCDVLGRTHMPRPIASAPYYAIRNQGCSVTSTVGLAVDANLRVVRRDGRPIPGLYAAGEILGAGQLQGDSFVGGMMAMPALTFGKLLGERLLAF